MLKTETNTKDINAMVEGLFDGLQPHATLDTFFEHGQWWITCNECGASWSVVDCNITNEFPHGLSTEQIDEGDFYCYKQD